MKKNFYHLSYMHIQEIKDENGNLGLDIKM